MITKEMLEKVYIQEERPMHECADILGISVGSVFNYLKKYGIESRPKMTEKVKRKISESNLGKHKRKGFHLSEETKRKLSDAQKGRFHIITQYGGHKKKRSDGYIAVYCPNHPLANKDGYVMEHILVMEEAIGRYITREEVVHHKNHKRNDNRLDNLELMTFQEHARLHLKERWEKRKEKNNE